MMWVKSLLKQDESRPLPLIDLDRDNSVQCVQEYFKCFEASEAIVFSGDTVLGTISKKDIEEAGLRADDKVSDLVKTQFVWVHPRQTLQDCLLLMELHNLREIPVIEDNFPVGVLELNEVISALIDEGELSVSALSLTKPRSDFFKHKAKSQRVSH